MTTPESTKLSFLILAVILVTIIAVILSWALFSMPPVSAGLSTHVHEYLPHSGVTAEVTAILINFRGYDTLLEMAVLLTALIAVWNLGTFQLPYITTVPDPIIDSLVRFLAPVMILVTGYVLWLGGHAAGGAFQAGALLAGAGVLLLLQPSTVILKESISLRLMIISGAAVFALAALITIFSGVSLLEYPKLYAGTIILVIESFSTISIGLILTLLFAGGRPGPGGIK